MAGTAALGLFRELRTRPVRNRPRTSRRGQVEHKPVATSPASLPDLLDQLTQSVRLRVATATGPPASSCTGYQKMAASMRWKNPCPASAAIPPPARTAPRSARPAPPAAPQPAHHGPLPLPPSARPPPPAPPPAHAATQNRMGAQAAHQAQAALHQSPAFTINATCRASSQKIRNQARPEIG